MERYKLLCDRNREYPNGRCKFLLKPPDVTPTSVARPFFIDFRFAKCSISVWEVVFWRSHLQRDAVLCVCSDELEPLPTPLKVYFEFSQINLAQLPALLNQFGSFESPGIYIKHERRGFDKLCASFMEELRFGGCSSEVKLICVLCWGWVVRFCSVSDEKVPENVIVFKDERRKFGVLRTICSELRKQTRTVDRI